MGVAKFLLLGGLFFFCLGGADSYALNFTEVVGFVFKIEVEVTENKTEVRCDKMKGNETLDIIMAPNNLTTPSPPTTLKPMEEDKRCPGNLLDAIGKMKNISIHKGMKDSMTGWKVDSKSGAFVVDIYYSLMEISFEKVPNVTNETFKINLQTTSKMRGQAYNCCHIVFNETDRPKPDPTVLFEPFNITRTKMEAGTNDLDFNYYSVKGIMNHTNAFKGKCSISSLECAEYLKQIRTMVEGEAAMFSNLLGVINFNSSVLFKTLDKRVNQFPSMQTVWAATDETYWATFSGQDVSKIDMDADEWKIVTISGGDEKPVENGGVVLVKGVEMLIVSVILALSPFSLFRF